jgi:hypothetical protein
MCHPISKRLPLPRLAEVLPEARAAATDMKAEYLLLLEEYESLKARTGFLEARLQFVAHSTCGVKDDTQPVELYDGKLGVEVSLVDRIQRPVGQLQWIDRLPQLFQGPNAKPGNVNGERWGSGTLLKGDLFLTAGHCFDGDLPNGWIMPSRRGIPISARDAAKLMYVNFDYQIDRCTKQLREVQSFPVIDLLEHREGGIDYAVLQLGPDRKGRRPSDLFGTATLATTDLTKQGAMLCVIQHPNRRDKHVEAGPLADNSRGIIAFTGLDTSYGSSGAMIADGVTGELVGIVTDGGCTPDENFGFNSGPAIGAMRAVSKYLT